MIKRFRKWAKAHFLAEESLGKTTRSAHEKQLIKFCKQQNRPIPAGLVSVRAKQKQMPDGMGVYWQLFHDLSPTRPQTFSGPGAIPYGEIVEHAKLWGLHLSGLDLTILRELDAVFLGVTHDRLRSTQSGNQEPRGSDRNVAPRET